LTLEHAEVVPYREYPVAARPVLGARYCTVCGIGGALADRYEHNVLLWSDEPFTETVVTRELTNHGFEVAAVSRTLDPRQPWTASVTHGPEPAAETYVGRFHGDWSTVGWIGLWARGPGYVVYDEPDHDWRAVPAAEALYHQHDRPSDTVLTLTGQQATGLAILAGRRLPTRSELAAALRAREDARWSSQQLWQRFYDHRAAVLAPEVRRLRTESARLADRPPPRRPVADPEEGRRAVARMPAARVRVGEPFPLVRFLLGRFADRRSDTYGSHTALCNRLELVLGSGETVGLTLELMVRGGLLVHPGAVTPYCPEEADYLDDPELAPAQAGQQWPDPLWCAVFPASPARFEVWGRPATPTAALQRLSIAVTFPGGPEFVALPAWSDSFHLWDYFAAAGAEPDPEEGHEIFVPDDINLMKAVRARIVEWPVG
jgi:hypothetical protein